MTDNVGREFPLREHISPEDSLHNDVPLLERVVLGYLAALLLGRMLASFWELECGGGFGGCPWVTWESALLVLKVSVFGGIAFLVLGPGAARRWRKWNPPVREAENGVLRAFGLWFLLMHLSYRGWDGLNEEAAAAGCGVLELSFAHLALPLTHTLFAALLSGKILWLGLHGFLGKEWDSAA